MTNPTACLLVIGNEVLSGRTQDANIRFIATRLGEASWGRVAGAFDPHAIVVGALLERAYPQ